MKGKLAYAIVASIALAGCSGGTLSETATTSEPPAPPPTSTPAPTPTTITTPTPAVATNSTCNEIAFYLDPALAMGFTCETVPADPGPVAPAPEMTRITLTGYPQSRTQWSERIYVISVDAWNTLDPILFNDKYSVLTGLLSASAPPPAYGTGGSTWTPPMLPDVGGIPAFFARYDIVPFTDGTGVRFLTELRYDAMPISNAGLLYTYQGVSADGQYWVSAFLPIENTSLVADENVLPGGYATWDDFWADYDPYVQGVAATLSSQPSGTFDPPIEDLDGLVSSIVFTP